MASETGNRADDEDAGPLHAVLGGWADRPGSPVPRGGVGSAAARATVATDEERRRRRRPRRHREILFFAWTIDGTEPTSQEDIFGVDVRSGAERRLTDDSSGVPFVSDRDPSWSPDRSQIVHMRADATRMRLVVSSASGLPVRELPVEGTTPIWVDDDTIMCSVPRLGPGGVFDRADLVAVDATTGTETPVTAVGPGDRLVMPAWHPVSGLVAVHDRQHPVTGMHLSTGLVHVTAGPVGAAIAGGPALGVADLTRLTHGTAWDASPAWSPDGTRLAFSTLRPCATRRSDGSPLLQSDIAMMALSTPSVVDLVTDDRARAYEDGINDGSPVFSPDGDRLAWVRGHEDDWTHIVVQRVGRPTTRRVVLGGRSWFRHGLDW